MQANIHTWEATLLSLAHEAKHSVTYSANHVFDSELLEASYTYCESLTAQHSRSFHLASSLLPPDKCRAIRALYAFCRVTDDIVDHSADGQAIQLEAWRKRTSSAMPPTTDLVAVAWADARHRHQVPERYAEQLIDGVARDLHQKRYATFAELAQYSYGVASTVGLMSMHIIGYAGVHALPYAIKLGVALQLTNILRDVAEDWQNGRLYLPQEELKQFDLSEEDIAAGRLSERWRRFMQFQIERNRHLYHEAWPGVAFLDPDGRFAIAAAADLYKGILDDIEKHNYDVFSRRARLSTIQKLGRLPGIWWRSRTVKVG